MIGQIAVRQQAIIWTNVDPILCRHMASLSNKGLTSLWQRFINTSQLYRCITFSVNKVFVQNVQKLKTVFILYVWCTCGHDDPSHSGDACHIT